MPSAAHRTAVELVVLAGLVDDVVEERVELGARQLDAGIGHGLDEVRQNSTTWSGPLMTMMKPGACSNGRRSRSLFAASRFSAMTVGRFRADDEDAADAYLAGLRQDHRYHIDVY